MGGDQGAKASLERSLASVRRSMTTLERVIRANRRLAEMPGHRTSARRRIRNAEAGLAILLREEGELLARLERAGEG